MNHAKYGFYTFTQAFVTLLIVPDFSTIFSKHIVSDKRLKQNAIKINQKCVVLFN